MTRVFRADDAGPNEPVVDPSPLVDEILGVLEKHNVPAAACDTVVRLVEGIERKRAPRQFNYDQSVGRFVDVRLERPSGGSATQCRAGGAA